MSGSQDASPLPGTVVIPTRFPCDALLKRLEDAVAAEHMPVVARASASAAAATQGFRIPGNAVVMVFRPDYARRMLAESVPAGIEAPIRFYLTENADGTSTLTYRTPSAVFAPYATPGLTALAAELDAVFARIAGAASQVPDG
jgi:uncharacterized protein (DUF302 family)